MGFRFHFVKAPFLYKNEDFGQANQKDVTRKEGRG